MLKLGFDSSSIKSTAIALLALSVSACSSLPKNDDPSLYQSADPLEGFNRTMHGFNSRADKYILRPATKVYDASLPKPAKNGVSNFFSNLNEPRYIVNNLLQGKFYNALSSSYRFVVNSTVGLGGLIDVAELHEVEKQPEDLGQTFAAWGMQPGPYLVLPFWGSTNLRDVSGRVLSNIAYYPINEISDDDTARAGLTGLSIIDQRAQLLDLDAILAGQTDKYLFLKTVYELNRRDALYDGNPPAIDDDFDDF